MLSCHSITVCCGHVRTALVHPTHYLSHLAISLVCDVHAGGREVRFFLGWKGWLWKTVVMDSDCGQDCCRGEGTKIFHPPVQQIYTRLCSSPIWRACLGRCPATEASLLKEKSRRDVTIWEGEHPPLLTALHLLIILNL